MKNHINGTKFITNKNMFIIHPKPSHSVRKCEKPRVPVGRAFKTMKINQEQPFIRD